MSQVRDLLVGAAESLFATHATKELVDSVESGQWPGDLWAAIEDAGLHDALVPEESGGAGVSFADAVAVLRCAGSWAVPVPLAEAMIATRLAAEAGLQIPPGPVALPPLDGGEQPTLAARQDGWSLTADLHGVPWARACVSLLVPCVEGEGSRLACLSLAAAGIDERTNLAGEPRDRVQLKLASLDREAASSVAAAFSRERVRRLGALARCALMSGALEKILEITVEYARERIQFGRPIGRFQAVQQQLAEMAGEVAAAKAATDAAADILDRGEAKLPIAAAKTRVGLAAGRAAAIAHQVHGAIGFTHEHELHHFTRRLWAWRDELGGEATWAEEAGADALAAGGGGLWPLLSRPD